MADRTSEFTSRLCDNAFFERELASFVPDKVFDAHAHIWLDKNMSPTRKTPSLPADAGFTEFEQMSQVLHPGRTCAANLFHRICERECLGDANAWAGEQIKHDARYRGLFISTPENDPAWLLQEVNRLGLHGLKCYHVYSNTNPTWEADLPAYLPESHVQLADQEGWVIMLHIVKSRACADPSNIKWIRHYCKSYPNMKLILAHSARGFQPAHNLEGLPQLKGLDNLYFDTSANCDPFAHQVILRTFGHKKLMYGTDIPVGVFRGRSVSVADTFLWLTDDSPVWAEKHQHIEPVFVGLEHLRSVKWACWSERLTDSQVEDVFWNNAADLFDVT